MSTDPAGLLTLEDPAATDETVAGGKAAGLARARALGLPVLPGLIVPAGRGARSLRAGAAALGTGGSGAARLAVMQEPVDESLLGALVEAVRPLGDALIVRSSSVLEGTGVWAGAFSTFEDVTAGELAVALRGVWASPFTVAALERFEMAGADPSLPHLAVLVQPQLRPDAGGTARTQPGGSVRISATKGPLADLVAGWDPGLAATVDADDEVAGDEAVQGIGEDVLLAVAGVARKCRELLGDDLIEWAHADGRVVLLQATRSGTQAPADAALPLPAAPVHPRCRSLALAAARHAGPLGEEIVIPWAAALEDFPLVDAGQPSASPLEDLARARDLAAAMAREAWQLRGSTVRSVVDRALRELLAEGPEAATVSLAGLRPVREAQARELLRLVDGVGLAAAAQGLVTTPRAVWRYSFENLARLLAHAHGVAEPASLGPGRWEPFVFATAHACGTRVTGGHATVPGIGAGLAVVARDPHDPPVLTGREVVVVERPLPGFAPLLWRACALVTTGGSPGAHLLEVAHSLGLPAVVGADLAAAGYPLSHLATEAGAVMAVDGHRGSVAVMTG